MKIQKIKEIKIKVVEKNDGRKEYLMWVVDNFGNTWHKERNGLKLGIPPFWNVEYDKETAISKLKELVEKQNRQFQRDYDNAVKSTHIESITI